MAGSPGLRTFPLRMRPHGGQVDAGQQPVQLLHTEDGNLGVLGPLEPVGLQSLDHQPEAGPFPQQDLDPVASPVAEDEQRRRECLIATMLGDDPRSSLGTSIRDYSAPAYVRKGGTVYQTVPGSSTRDYGAPIYVTNPKKAMAYLAKDVL